MRQRARSNATTSILESIEPAERQIVERARPYSMTSDERLVAILDAVSYAVAAGVRGAFVECGVWRGGSVLAMVLQLERLGVSDRDIWLYDTFEGMTAPTTRDTSRFSEPALATWRRARETGGRAWEWVFGREMFDIDSVRSLLAGTGYPGERVHFVEGPIEKTVPGEMPASMALLRLDTDWYESTRHELIHLYPHLEQGGVLIIDDYGHWDGCRKAVDEYFANEGGRPLLSRIDYTGRIGTKP